VLFLDEQTVRCIFEFIGVIITWYIMYYGTIVIARPCAVQIHYNGDNTHCYDTAPD